jgi:hypothetical protein
VIVIGLTGKANAGKTLVASMLPGFLQIGFADPLYNGLAAMLEVSADFLRAREAKESPLPDIGRSPRELLQTLGTDWGRDLVHPHLWTLLARRRIKCMEVGAITDRVAICDVRFTNEVEMIRSLGGEVWRVVRPGAETTPHQHRSENGLPDSAIDCTIVNDCGIDDLRGRVLAAWEASRAALAR